MLAEHSDSGVVDVSCIDLWTVAVEKKITEKLNTAPKTFEMQLVHTRKSWDIFLDTAIVGCQLVRSQFSDCFAPTVMIKPN